MFLEKYTIIFDPDLIYLIPNLLLLGFIIIITTDYSSSIYNYINEIKFKLFKRFSVIPLIQLYTDYQSCRTFSLLWQKRHWLWVLS